MLDAAEALLLGGGDEHAVAHERGREIAVEGVEAKDDHKPCSTDRLLDRGVAMPEPGRFGHCSAVTGEARRRGMFGRRESRSKLIIRKTDRRRPVRGQSK